jgi:hypothetical protein
VLVVVAIMRCVPVPAVDVIDVVAVADRAMPASGLVGVAVVVVDEVRERVLVVMVLVGCVRVALVHVVGVALTLHAGVPAARAVFVLVPGMNLVRSGAHRSSLGIGCGSSVLC